MEPEEPQEDYANYNPDQNEEESSVNKNGLSIADSLKQALQQRNRVNQRQGIGSSMAYYSQKAKAKVLKHNPVQLCLCDAWVWAKGLFLFFLLAFNLIFKQQRLNKVFGKVYKFSKKGIEPLLLIQMLKVVYS